MESQQKMESQKEQAFLEEELNELLEATLRMEAELNFVLRNANKN